MTAMNRRSFLTRLGFGTVAAAAAANGLIDVERLLWAPGEKTIFIPSVAPMEFALCRGDIFTIDGYYAFNPVTGLYTKQLQKFTVTADVRIGENLTIEPIWPFIDLPKKTRINGKRVRV